jgi:octaprenyl-diphosphate synthase
MSSFLPPSHPKDLLITISQELAPEMKRVEAMIENALAHRITLIPEVGGHLIASGGKRLRPLMLMACARLCGYQGDDHIKLATCLEFIHNATLLHDDVMDQSHLRRGKPTAHQIWGAPASIVVGDFLLCRALELMTEVESWPIVHLINHMATKIIEGQTLDLSWSQHLSMDEATYLEMTHLKTAWLFQAACELGALVAQHPEKEALKAFGYHLGMAFQLMDDVIDYTSTADILGKNPGQDFQEAKVTLPVILALAKASPEERAFWERTLKDHVQTADDFAQARQIMTHHKVFEQVIASAQVALDKAAHNLEPFPESPLKKALLNVLQFIHQQAF